MRDSVPDLIRYGLVNLVSRLVLFIGAEKEKSQFISSY